MERFIAFVVTLALIFHPGLYFGARAQDNTGRSEAGRLLLELSERMDDLENRPSEEFRMMIEFMKVMRSKDEQLATARHALDEAIEQIGDEQIGQCLRDNVAPKLEALATDSPDSTTAEVLQATQSALEACIQEVKSAFENKFVESLRNCPIDDQLPSTFLPTGGLLPQECSPESFFASLSLPAGGDPSAVVRALADKNGDWSPHLLGSLPRACLPGCLRDENLRRDAERYDDVINNEALQAFMMQQAMLAAMMLPPPANLIAMIAMMAMASGSSGGRKGGRSGSEGRSTGSEQGGPDEGANETTGNGTEPGRPPTIPIENDPDGEYTIDDRYWASQRVLVITNRANSAERHRYKLDDVRFGAERRDLADDVVSVQGVERRDAGLVLLVSVCERSAGGGQLTQYQIIALDAAGNSEGGTRAEGVPLDPEKRCN